MKGRCEEWGSCENIHCPHYGEHDLSTACSRRGYCSYKDSMMKCAEIVDPVPVVERKDASA